ncbi:MAG: YncE family protein [Vicinamibacterales bacterium]
MRVLLTLALVFVATGADAQRPARALSPAGGDHLLYIGTYAGTIQIFDEATETMVGDIKLQTGIPRSLTLSKSRSRFYVLDSTLEKIEIVDIPARTSLSTFTLSEGSKQVRIRGLQVDPLERFLILLTRSATKLVDRWEIGDIAMQLYDLAGKKVTRTIPWPRGEEREFFNIRFSPDGKLLYFFGDDVLILETTNFTEVDTWELSRSLEPGLGRVSFDQVDDFNEDPGFFTGLFTVTDPVQNRRIMSLGRVNLVAKSVDLTPIGPAESVGFALAPDRTRGYGLMQQIGRYEFWAFDVQQKKLVSRTPFDGRPRMALRVSSNGRLLYVFQAGATIDVYDVASYKRLRTIEMNADQTTNLFILPRK